jgi:hypothetical protein
MAQIAQISGRRKDRSHEDAETRRRRIDRTKAQRHLEEKKRRANPQIAQIGADL